MWSFRVGRCETLAGSFPNGNLAAKIAVKRLPRELASTWTLVVLLASMNWKPHAYTVAMQKGERRLAGRLVYCNRLQKKRCFENPLASTWLTTAVRSRTHRGERLKVPRRIRLFHVFCVVLAATRVYRSGVERTRSKPQDRMTAVLNPQLRSRERGKRVQDKYRSRGINKQRHMSRCTSQIRQQVLLCRDALSPRRGYPCPGSQAVVLTRVQDKHTLLGRHCCRRRDDGRPAWLTQQECLCSWHRNNSLLLQEEGVRRAVKMRGRDAKCFRHRSGKESCLS